MAKYTARWTALAVLALSLGGCVTARRPDPEAIADTSVSDAKALPGEFYHALIGHDRLRGPLPTN